MFSLSKKLEIVLFFSLSFFWLWNLAGINCFFFASTAYRSSAHHPFSELVWRLGNHMEVTWMTWPGYRTIFPEKTSAWACGSVAGALAWRIWTGSGAACGTALRGLRCFFWLRGLEKWKSYGKARNMIFMIAADHLIEVNARSFVNLGGTRSPSWNHMPMFFMLITGPLVVPLVI